MSGPSWRVRPPARLAGDRGTMIPMIMLCFLLAGILGCASIAASAAFLAQRDLAGVCDGAAIAAAGAVSRASLGTAPPGGQRPSRGPDGGSAAEVLPLDAGSVDRIVAGYQANLASAGSPIWMTAGTDGRAVTVTCRRTIRLPFGRLLGHPDGLDRTAVARARSPLD